MILTKHINFEIEKAEIIEENPNSQFATAKLLLFSSGVNRHSLTCSEQVLQDTAPSAYEKPIIFEYDRRFNDFGTHNETTTVPAGFIVPNSAEFIRLEDGRLSLHVLGKIWKKYSGKFLKIFADNQRIESKLSVEMELLDCEERPDGLGEMKNFAYAAACILGDLVTEASPGANIQLLSFAEEYNSDYLKEFSSKYSELDLSIPEPIKQNANKALSLYKDYGKGANSVVLAASRFISKNSMATPEKIRQIHKLLNSYSKKDLSEKIPPSSEYISYLALGGSEGHKWSSELMEQIDEIDARKLSYFNASQDDNEKKEVETFMEDEKDKQEEVKEEEKKEEMAADESKKEDEKDEKKEEMAADEKESPEDEKKEDEKEEEKEFDFSLMLNALKEETEEYSVFAAEIEKPEVERNFSKTIAYMYAKICKLSEDMKKMSAEKEDAEKKFADVEEENKTFMAENEELKKFKANIEQERFNFEIGKVMNEVKENMPKEEFDNLQEKSKEFSLANVDTFKNLARAKAFEFSKGMKKDDDGIKRYALPWNTSNSEKTSIWD
jgi:hypothetical protein